MRENLKNARGERAMKNIKEDKIQTGLRIPEKRYRELNVIADEMGVSLNALILMLIDLGLTLRNGRIILQKESE